MDGTILFFVSHASLLIRYENDLLLTDPWFESPAFASWTPCPPPTINPDVLVGLSRAGKLAITISHAHTDHADVRFLSRIDPATPILIPQFSDNHFARLLSKCGCRNVIEISNEGLEYKSFRLNRFLSHLTSFDSAISIETPDFFLFHGNDFWRLDDAGKARLMRLKPHNKRSIFAGQGGSASGHPLIYHNVPEEDRIRLLIDKNSQMFGGVGSLAKECGFDYALAYACFTKIDVPGYEYSFLGPTPNGPYCNSITGLDLFMDLSPGDIFLARTGTVVPILRTLHVPLSFFPTIGADSDLTEKFGTQWTEDDEAKLRHFAGLWRPYCERRQHSDSDALQVNLSIKVNDLTGDTLTTAVLNSVDEPVCSITYSVRVDTAKALLARYIPTEYLETGYLVRVERHPIDYFSQDFYNLWPEFGYVYKSGAL